MNKMQLQIQIFFRFFINEGICLHHRAAGSARSIPLWVIQADEDNSAPFVLLQTKCCVLPFDSRSHRVVHSGQVVDSLQAVPVLSQAFSPKKHRSILGSLYHRRPSEGDHPGGYHRNGDSQEASSAFLFLANTTSYEVPSHYHDPMAIDTPEKACWWKTFAVQVFLCWCGEVTWRAFLCHAQVQRKSGYILEM